MNEQRLVEVYPIDHEDWGMGVVIHIGDDKRYVVYVDKDKKDVLPRVEKLFPKRSYTYEYKKLITVDLWLDMAYHSDSLWKMLSHIAMSGWSSGDTMDHNLLGRLFPCSDATALKLGELYDAMMDSIDRHFMDSFPNGKW